MATKGVVEIEVGKKVNTPDGEGKVISVKDDLIGVELTNGKKGNFRPRYVSLVGK